MLFGLYVIGIVGGVATALLLRSSVLRGENPTFILALPEFRLPNVRNVAMKLLDRVRVFLRRAGTVIFAVAVVVWALTYFPRSPDVERRARRPSAEATATLTGAALEERLADDRQPGGGGPPRAELARPGGAMGRARVPAARLGLARLGGGHRGISRRARSSSPCSARSTPSASEADEETLAGRLTRGASTPTAAPSSRCRWCLGLLLFYAWCLQCAATLAVIRRETNSWRWPLFAWSYMTALGYGGALLIYQLGTA